MDGLKILTLSGWTQPANALLGLAPHADVLDYAGCASLGDVAAKLKQREYDLVIGWSLGGILARQLMHAHGLSARAMVSIASPYQFVRGGLVHEAMPPDIFEQFYSNYRDDTVRTVKRFHGLLVKGDAHEKKLLGAMAHHPQVGDVAKWLPWMDFLRGYSAREHDYALPPTLIIHGANDAIVPARQASMLARYIGAEMLILDEAGHAPHWHAPGAVGDAIEQFTRKHVL